MFKQLFCPLNGICKKKKKINLESEVAFRLAVKFLISLVKSLDYEIIHNFFGRTLYIYIYIYI